MEEDNNRKNILIRKSLIYLVGNFSSKILGTLIIPIYAAYLSASELGAYDYQQSIGNLLSPIFALAIWEAILRFGLGKSKRELVNVLTSAMFIALATLSISFVLLISTYYFIYGINIKIILFILMIILMPILSICQYSARASGNNIAFVKSSILASFSNLLSLVIFVMSLKSGLLGLLISTIIANLINIIYLSYNIKIWRYFDLKNVDVSLMKSMILYSIPLALNLMSVWFITGFSRFYTNIFLGTTNNGIYAFAAKFSMILATLSQVVNMAIIEDTVMSIGDINFSKRFESTAREVINLLFLLIFLLMPTISIYYNFVPNIDYQNSLILVPILLYSTVLQNFSTLTGNIFNAYNKTNYFFYTTILGSLVNILLTFTLGAIWGISGVAFAQLFGFLSMFLSRYFLGIRISRYKLNWNLFLVFTFIYCIVSYLALKQNLLINVVLIGLILFFLIICYKKFLWMLVGKVIKKFK